MPRDHKPTNKPPANLGVRQSYCLYTPSRLTTAEASSPVASTTQPNTARTAAFKHAEASARNEYILASQRSENRLTSPRVNSTRVSVANCGAAGTTPTRYGAAASQVGHFPVVGSQQIFGLPHPLPQRACRQECCTERKPSQPCPNGGD